MKPPELKKDPEDEIPLEILERAIVDCAEGARKLLGSHLTDRAIQVLLKDSTGLPMADIATVLAHAANLDQKYIKRGGRR